MKTVAAVRNSGIAVVFVAGLVSYAGPAVGASSSYCSTHPSDRITTCFLDLTKAAPQHVPLSGGIFVGTSAELGAPVGAGPQPSVSIQQSGGIRQGAGRQLQSPTNDDMGVRIRNGSIRLGDIAKVLVCDFGDLRDRRDGSDRRCARYYEFLLDTNEGADGANGSVSLDEFKVLAGGDGVYDMDGGPRGDVSVLTNYNNPDGNGEFRALIPVSSFSSLPDDTFVYVYSTFNGASSTCQEGSRESPCPAPASGDAVAAAVPLSPTALLLGIGLMGMVLVRRRRSPDLGVPH